MNQNNSWNEWANHILNSTKRFGEEIKELKIEINSLNKDTNNIKTELVKFTASNRIDLIDEHFKNLITALQVQVSSLQDASEKHDKNIEELNRFKIKILAIGGTINAILAIALATISAVKGNN